MKFMTFALLTFVTAAVHAVPYQLPADESGWYQLQDTETYETLCFTGSSQPCDVPAGVYTLINHDIERGSPGHRVSIEIGGTGGSSGASIVYETKTCDVPFTDGPFFSGIVPECRDQQCSVGMLTGGSCHVTFYGHADADEFRIDRQTRMSQSGYTCSISNAPHGETFDNPVFTDPEQGYRFIIGLACLTQ